jgi:hypothetical protein
MRRLTTFALLSVIFAGCSIQSVFGGPFGIDMGMSLAEVRQVSKMIPKLIQDNVYEITPPKTNDMFKTYYVRIDPEYGVYWLKAIGKDIYTNGYGGRVRSEFESLVASIRRTYGEENSMTDEVKEDVNVRLMKDPEYFMMALERGDRTLQAYWSKKLDILNMLLEDEDFLNKMKSSTPEELENLAKDTTAIQSIMGEELSQYNKLPNDISAILVSANAQSSSVGSVWLEYSFSNNDAVDAKADSVF